MVIQIPDSFRKEFQEQFIGDMEYEGFNREALLLEWLKEEIGMETEPLRLV